MLFDIGFPNYVIIQTQRYKPLKEDEEIVGQHYIGQLSRLPALAVQFFFSSPFSFWIWKFGNLKEHPLQDLAEEAGGVPETMKLALEKQWENKMNSKASERRYR